MGILSFQQPNYDALSLFYKKVKSVHNEIIVQRKDSIELEELLEIKRARKLILRAR